jgi:putative inorganic carbon (HCO3(-)) transporter
MHKVAVLINRFQWVLLLLAAPFLLFPSVQRRWVLLLVPLLWLLSWLATKKPLPSTPLNLPLLVLLLMLLVSLYATYDIEVSLPKISGLILGVGMFYALIQAIRSGRGIQLALILYFFMSMAISVVSFFGLRQVQKFTFLQPMIDRLPQSLINLPGAEGGFHPNEVAGTLLWILPIILILFCWLIIKRKRIFQDISRPLYVVVIALLFLSIIFTVTVFILTQSRTAFIALFLSLLLLPLLLLPEKVRIPGAVTLMILLGIFGWLAWQQNWLQWLYEVTTPGGTQASFLTFNSRIDYWEKALTLIGSFPFTGIGMNTFRFISSDLYPFFTTPNLVDIGHAHNEFLQVALDLGIPGLIAFLSINFVTFNMLYDIWNKAGGRRFSRNATGLDLILLSSSGIKALVLGIGLSLIAHALFGMIDAIALGAKPGILFWMLLGLAAGLHTLVCGGVIIQRQTIKHES